MIGRIVLTAILITLFTLGAKAQLPSPWVDADIGSPLHAGSATYSSGVFTVTGAGTGYSGTADQLNFCYQAFTGNFVFVARMTSNAGSAGIMMRDSLSAGARETTIYSPNGAGGAWLYWRPTTGDNSSLSATYSGPGSAPYYPLWVKISRHNDYIYRYYSLDGTNWISMYGQDYALDDPDLPATVYVGMTSTPRNTGAAVAATFDNVSVTAESAIPSLPGKVITSWIGNSLPQGANDNKMQYDIDGMYVAPDGTVYCNTWREDLAQAWGVYKSGQCEGFISTDAQSVGGAAVTGDGTFVYIAQAITQNGPPSGTVWYTVRRVNASTWAAAPFTGGTGQYGDMIEIGAKTTGTASPGNVWGLACNPATSTLYASDTLNGKIDVINTSTMAISSSWTLPTGYAPYGLCWDAKDSLLWVIVQNTSTSARQIWAYNTSGVQQTALTITSAVNPVAMTMGSSGNPTYGHLYVADDGSDQNIKVYQSLTTTPTLWITYGTTGGTFSGTGATIGTVGNFRFNGLTSVGIDSSGNLYVAYDGKGPDLNEDNTYRDQKYGATLESFNATSNAMNWTLKALEFFDDIYIDPSTETSAYGNGTHYALNWSNTTPGTEWSAVGNTLNFKKYPTDYRLNASNTSSPVYKMVHIGGQLFQALGDGYHLEFYRFNSSTDGEGAIPCAEFNVSTTDPGHTGLAIWTDANGDGVRQLTEVSYLGNYINPMFGADIDSNGTIWTTNGSGTVIDKFPCAGLNSANAPEYSPTTMTAITAASLPGSDKFTAINDVRYDTSNDTMYLLGFTSSHPVSGANCGQGTVVQCMTHWSTTPVLAWESVLPVYFTGNFNTAKTFESMALAGSYAFLQYGQNYQTLVLAKSSGAIVGALTPDPGVVGNMSPILVDQTHGVSAFERSNGEYIITVEDDIFNKSVMYRWTPWTDVDIGTVGLAGSSSYNVSTGTFTVNGSGVGAPDYTSSDACHFTYLPITGDFTFTAYVGGVTCTSVNARAGIAVRNDLSTGPMGVWGLATTTAGDRVGGFWRTTTNGSPAGNDPAGVPPAWFKIVRSGNSFSVYGGTDGVTWSLYGTNTIAMASTVDVGLQCAAASTTVQATATISNVQITQP
jgi:regulation of enolase protein 1 (concanavalin A-like superfamily)